LHRLIEEQFNNCIEVFKLNLEARPDHDLMLRQQIDCMGQMLRLADVTPPSKFQEALDAFRTYVSPFKIKDLA